MLKRHHFHNLSVMREGSSQVSRCLGESRDIVYDLMNEKINTDMEYQQYLDEIITEHQSN